MSHTDCILEEIDPMNNQKVVNQDEQIEEICSPEHHIDECKCFQKQEQQIKQLQEELDRQRKIQEEKKKQKCAEEQQQKEKQLQEELDRQRKIQEGKKKQKCAEEQQQKENEAKMEELRVKINECAKLVNEQKVIANTKHKEAFDATQLYYKFYSEYQNNLNQYKLLDIKKKIKYSYSEYNIIPNLFNISYQNIKF